MPKSLDAPVPNRFIASRFGSTPIRGIAALRCRSVASPLACSTRVERPLFLSSVCYEIHRSLHACS